MDFNNVLKTSVKFNPATRNQMQALEKLGYVPSRKISFEDATKVLDTLMNRVRSGLCTLRQGRILKENGYDPKHITFEQATKVISKLFESQDDGLIVY